MDFKNIDNVSYLILYCIKNVKYAKNLKIQKLIYIYEQESDKKLFRKYEDDFQASKYGPFSKEVWKMIDMLLANKFIYKNDGYSYEMTTNGENILTLFENSDKINIDIDKEYFKLICDCFKEYNSIDILKYVYHEYKQLLKNSLIIDELTYEEKDHEWIKSTKEDLQAAKERNKKIL